MNAVSFYGTETSGSIGKKDTVTTERRSEPVKIPPAEPDSVSFHGYNNEEKRESSFGKKLAIVLGSVALLVGGLGYAHKAQWVEKISNKSVKDFANKVTEPCHTACSKLKGWTTQGWDKVKNLFSKKS